MKAYVQRVDKRLEPFDEPARDCLVLDQTIADMQAGVFAKMGMEMISVSDASEVSDANEHLVLGDNLYFTPELLCEFVKRSMREKSSTVCALKHGVTTLRTAISVQDVKTCGGYTEYNLRYFPEVERRKNLRTVVIEPDGLSAPIAMPHHICRAREYVVPMTERFVIQVDHWANLWAANIAAILAGGARLQKSSKAKLLFLALKARSFNKWKILCRLNKIGRNCDVHPTAYIEGSAIGDGVAVGAGAVVRESVIGEGSFIGNGVVVEESVIGEGSTILNGHILYSVLYPHSFSVAEMVSASLVGRDTFMGLNSTLTDFRLDGKNVTVLKDGVAVDSGNIFLGSCLGHGVYLGSGCIVAPGRTVPCGLHLAARKDQTIWESFNGQVQKDFRLIEK
jgi:acetyltransferase-like isoleucine patch superfamily enzyme